MINKALSSLVAFVSLALAVFAVLYDGPALLLAQTPAGEYLAAGGPFTYQGRLTSSGAPANGSFDLRFTLHTAPTGGAVVGSANVKEDVVIANGLFTVQLDFGAGAFNGAARYLEVRVRPGSSTEAYTTLTPRQAINPAPYALYAYDTPASVPAGAIIMWSGRLDALPPGWVLCDGTNGTPDLRGRFVLGAAQGENPGRIGGSSAHQHTVDAHAHQVNPPVTTTTLAGGHEHTTGSVYGTMYSFVTCSGDLNCSWGAGGFNHYHAVNTNGSHQHNVNIGAFASATATATTNTVGNLPPYYAVAFLMKQ